MSHLDEAMFSRLLRACEGCGASRFLVHAVLDRAHDVMAGERNDDGRWAHDGEGFIDGISRITCVACQRDAYRSEDCPRCHAVGALPAAREAVSRLSPPKRCPRCHGLEVSALGFAPARTEVISSVPQKAVAEALLGEAGFHVVAVACASCEWAIVAEGCPICGQPSPIRARAGG